MKKIFIIITLILISSHADSLEIDQIFDFRTGAELNTTLGARSLNEAKYELTLDKHWQFSPGFLLAPGWSFLSAYHLEIGYKQLFTPPLSIHLKFLNRSYHVISIAENSIIPYLGWRSKNFEADFGLNVRFTNFEPNYLNLIFYYPGDLVQPFFVFRIAGYFVWENPDIRLGVEIKNNEWNYAGNSYELSFHIDGIYQITKVWGLKLNLGTSPSGISGISFDFNRYNFLIGAQYHL